MGGVARGPRGSPRRAPAVAQEAVDRAGHHLRRGARIGPLLRLDRRADLRPRRGLLAAGVHAAAPPVGVVAAQRRHRRAADGGGPHALRGSRPGRAGPGRRTLGGRLPAEVHGGAGRPARRPEAAPAAAATFAGLAAQQRFGIVFRLDGVVRAETRARKLAGYVAQLERGESPV
ncbi:YdeI/OmpD-associated family protein [Microcella flavibacter]|uniref:YdeI/OmpD-associated family protein n=1 Tax=Microcella flavibacter TaxID=1804990 RepID=UPI002B27BD9F|nr:YdeI/OmpD-associated family protein [Microcella flavibacter]